MPWWETWLGKGVTRAEGIGTDGVGGGDVWSGYATETHDKFYKYTLVEVEGEINMV